MAFFQGLFLISYFGIPVFILYRWIRIALSTHKSIVWSMAVALGLWLLQAAALIYSIAICLSGHCRVAPIQEYGVYALVVCAFIGIGALLWLSWRRHGR